MRKHFVFSGRRGSTSSTKMSRNISALDTAKSESDHQEVSVIDLPKHAVKDVAVPFEDALREIGE